MPSHNSRPDADRRRIVVLTGASSGIGAAAAPVLAERGDHLVLVGRNADRLRAVADRVAERSGRRPDTRRVDFAELDQVRELGAYLNGAYDAVDVLVNNAGALFGVRHTTVDGWEMTVQVNYLASFLLSHLLFDRLRAAATLRGEARIVSTASLAEIWGWVRPHRLSGPRFPYSRWLAYGSSKQALVLFTAEAARRWAGTGIVPTSLHPGIVRTRFGGWSLLMRIAQVYPVLSIGPSQAARGIVTLACDELGREAAGEFLMFGLPFVHGVPGPASPRSSSRKVAAALWEHSLTAVGLTDRVGQVGGSRS